MQRIATAAIALAMSAGSSLAAPLQPMRSAVSGVPFAQMLGTAETLGDWGLLYGGHLRLIQVTSRNGNECGVEGVEEDADQCPRHRLYVVLNGQLATPVGFTAFQLPEVLWWMLPKDFKPDESSATAVIPLRACEMKRSARGFVWQGASYTLRVTETLVGGARPLRFTASLSKMRAGRPQCDD